MISETIGSGQDHSSISGWEASVNNTDDETGTCMDASDLQTTNMTFDASDSGGYTYLLTADSAVEVDGPTYAAMTGKARMGGRIFINGSSSFEIERIGTLYATSHLIQGAGASFRRLVCDTRFQMFGTWGSAKTVTLTNCAFITSAAVYNDKTNCTVKAYFCSVINGTGNTCFDRGGSAVVECYGCITQGSATGFNNVVGDWNVSQDTTAVGDSGSSYYARSETNWFEDVGAGTQDLSLASAEQGWWAANKTAISLTGFPSDCDTDLVGTARTGGVDIDPGVWQTPGGGGGGATVPQGLSSIRTAYGAVRALVDLEVG